jgi:hypothetical protein
LGDYYDFYIRPRLNIGPYATITGAYYHYGKQSDRYTGTFVATPQDTGGESVTLNASVLEAGTDISIQRAGLGLRIANYVDQAAKAARMPMEFSFMYMNLIGSSGYGVPDASTLILQLRVHMGLFGG